MYILEKMVKKSILFFVLALVLVLSLVFVIVDALSSDSTTSTEWTMFGRYNNRTNWDGVAFTRITGLNMVNYTPGGNITHTPIVSNGYIYVNSKDGKLFQLNATNITQHIKNYTIADATINNISLSTPVIASGYVYIGSWSNSTLYQLNASNISQQIANFTAGNITSTPVVANGYVYISNSSIGNFSNNLYQLNASNISLHIANRTIDSNISAPVVANGYVYISTLNNVIQLNASNVSLTLIGNYTPGGVYASDNFAVANDYVYVGRQDGKLYQLNASNVSLSIANYTIGLGNTTSFPAVANGYVYVGSSDKKVYQLNASNISLNIANFTTGGNITSSPVVANGFVYVGSQDNKLYQLNASNISLNIANYTTGGKINNSAPAVANGYVYVGSSDGKLYQLNANNISMSDDFVAPNMTFASPVNGSTYTTSSVVVSITNSSDAVYVWWYNESANLTYSGAVTLSLSNGAHTFIAYANDSSGNVNSSSYTFFINVSAAADSSSGGGSSAVTSFWSLTHVSDESSFKNGFTKELKAKERIKVLVDKQEHFVGIISIAGNSAVINVSSTPQQATLNIGEEKKFDVNNDGYYDILVGLVTIGSKDGVNKASITVKSIYEKVSAVVTPVTKDNELDTPITDDSVDKSSSKNWLIWLIILVVVVIIIVVIVLVSNGKFGRNNKYFVFKR